MTVRTLSAMALLAVGCLIAPALWAQTAADTTLPEGVTPAMVKEGGKVFAGAGMCAVCHGKDGKGGVGANLTDSLWLHSKGSFDEIVHQITVGVPANETKNGVPMPPKGGSSINDKQIKAVAAYVWTLSHPPAK